jgi:hypothetical protein
MVGISSLSSNLALNLQLRQSSHHSFLRGWDCRCALLHGTKFKYMSFLTSDHYLLKAKVLGAQEAACKADVEFGIQ